MNRLPPSETTDVFPQSPGEHRGPLAGLRLLELGGIGPVPFAGVLLADMGAEVIRVEAPDFVHPLLARSEDDPLNRGKRIVRCDLKAPEGRDVVERLLQSADFMTEGFRPGVLERLDLAPTELLAKYPSLIIGRMTGWGSEGPLAPYAGHDINFLALTGALHAMGDARLPPSPPLNLVGDFGGGAMYLALGLVSAKIESRETGRGQIVEASIVGGVSHLMLSIKSMLLAGSWSDDRTSNLLDGGAPFYRCYGTKDAKWIAVGAIEPKFYANLVGTLGVDCEVDRQYDRASWPHVEELLRAKFASMTRDEIVALFEGSDACVSPVLTLRESTEHPQVAQYHIGETPYARPHPKLSTAPSLPESADVVDASSAVWTSAPHGSASDILVGQ